MRSLLVLALARPQLDAGKEQIRLRSRNIIVALDISSSMKATDFQPGNRLMVARATLRDFVARREGDLVGLVLFSGKAFLQAPLTADMTLIGRMLDLTDIGQLPDGTAIGTALAVSINQLKKLPAASSTVVLITDGANNTGSPTLPQATEMARALGIRVHAIGLTSADTTQYDLNGVWSVRTRAAKLSKRDEETLRRVAERTGGTFARATRSCCARQRHARHRPARAHRGADPRGAGSSRALSGRPLLRPPHAGPAGHPRRHLAQDGAMIFAVPAVLFLLVALPFAATWLIRHAQRGARRRACHRSVILPCSRAPACGSIPVHAASAPCCARRPSASACWRSRARRAARYDTRSNRSGRDLLVALDLSRSMLVQDAGGTRLDRAKTLAKDLADELPGDRVGLVIFGGAAFLQLPMTNDHAVFDRFIDAAHDQRDRGPEHRHRRRHSR